MNYDIRRVSHEILPNGTAMFYLSFQRGRDEALVTVTNDDGEIEAACEELPADSPLDEYELEAISEDWVIDYGGAMGDVGTL